MTLLLLQFMDSPDLVQDTTVNSSSQALCRSDSVETISVEGCCIVCNTGAHSQALITLCTDTDKTIFIDKSTVLLICAHCRHVQHMHCHLNRVDLTVDDLVAVVELLPFICSTCLQ
jgi:hypothetical protein